MQQQLDLLAQALARGDDGRAQALAPPGSPGAGQRLRQAAENAAAVKVRDISWQYLRSMTNPDHQGQWTAEVSLGWRLAGFDSAPTFVQVVSRFQRASDGSIGIVDPAESGQVPTWLRGQIQVRRGSGIQVIAEDPSFDVVALHTRAVAAAGAVQKALPGWDGRGVIEVPVDAVSLDQRLGREPGQSWAVAAVTAPAGDGSDSHVFVNPDQIGDLDSLGARVVLRHELVHLATGSAQSRAPLWLVEGFADQVALREVRRPASVIAADLIDFVRARGPMRTLPRSQEFATSGPELSAAYQGAWLACVLISERDGEDALLAFYTAADRGQPVGQALRRHVGLSLVELTRAWRERQRRLTGTG